MIRNMLTEDDGVLSFEWTLLVTLLTLGVVGGLTAARDGIIDELGDLSQAMLAIDDSYTIVQPLTLTIDPDGAGPLLPVAVGGGSDSGFVDAAIYADCDRVITANQQPAQDDSIDGG